MEIFGIPHQAFMGQLLLGLVNGAFYAMLSLGLAVIFGLLDIVNFAHGALYMLGAFSAWIMLDKWGVNYWFALILAPLVVGALGVIIERLFLKHLYGLDPLYGLLLTFGLSLILEGVFREQYGVSGQNYPVPELLSGATNLGFMVLPNYRAWVVLASLVVCLGTWCSATCLPAWPRSRCVKLPLATPTPSTVPSCKPHASTLPSCSLKPPR